MMARPGYLSEFARFWSERPEVKKIWFSLYTPQEGDASEERLRPHDREILFDDLSQIAAQFPKVYLPKFVLDSYRNPPRSPEECTFARLTTCISADLTTRITPCQFGGNPVCAECGCVASAGLDALANVKLGGFLPLSSIVNASIRIGGRQIPEEILPPRQTLIQPEPARDEVEATVNRG
jgi:hypothetical protein